MKVEIQNSCPKVYTLDEVRKTPGVFRRMSPYAPTLYLCSVFVTIKTVQGLATYYITGDGSFEPLDPICWQDDKFAKTDEKVVVTFE